MVASVKKYHDLLTMSETKKEVEKVPKKKVPRTEKRKTADLFRSNEKGAKNGETFLILHFLPGLI